MDVEIKLTKNELKKISLDFRMVANRLIRTKSEEGISNLKRFLNYIDNNPIIIKFIQQHNNDTFDIESIIRKYPHLNYSIPDDSQTREMSFIYQLLKYGLDNYNNTYGGYYDLAYAFSGYVGTIQAAVDKFNSSIVLPFYGYIENYLTKLQIDMGDDENARITIHVQGDNYGHNIGATMTEMNINQNNSSFGVGVNQGEISAEKLVGTINHLQTSENPNALQLAELLNKLKIAIEAEPELSADDKEVALEQVAVLADEGQNLNKESGFKPVKTAIAALKGTVVALPQATELVKEFNQLLPLIAQIFGLG